VSGKLLGPGAHVPDKIHFVSIKQNISPAINRMNLNRERKIERGAFEDFIEHPLCRIDGKSEN
jgi:hypothetical protein